MKRVLIIVALITLALSLPALGADRTNLLPKTFAGWTKVTPAQTSTDPSIADPTNAALLKEDGFSDLETAEYTRADRKITLKAARFADASGAYAAFTVYKSPDMTAVDMGGKPGESAGASLANRVLFYRQNVLVQAMFDKITAMTAAELRELAAALPEAQGPAKNLPILPSYLPKQSSVANSTRYVIGPIGLAQVGSPIPEQAVGFSQGAEVVVGKYTTSEGISTLMLISYPTPAIAGEHDREIKETGQNPPAATNPELAGPIYVKRTGPIVVLAAGKISADEAKSLLASVNYDADVTWNQNTYLNKKDNVANLLVNVVMLIAVLIVLSLGIGLAFGGVRLAVKRFLPGRIFDRPEELEIIQLRIGKSSQKLETTEK
jgi:hypothetical protein